MRRIFLIGGLLMVFGLAFTFGYSAEASAQSVTEADFSVAVAPGTIAPDDEGDHRGPRPVSACMRVALQVHKVCTCEGLKDEDGTVEPWKNHGEFVQCVKDQVDLIAEAHENVPEECLKGIEQRAQQSDIGKPDFECPQLKERRRAPRQLPRMRAAVQCTRIAMNVQRACPCQGPLGEDGKPLHDPDGNRVAWGDHGEYVQCVKDKTVEIAANHENVPEECLQKIEQRAEESDIGTPGFECPKPQRPEHPGPGGPGPQPGRP